MDICTELVYFQNSTNSNFSVCVIIQITISIYVRFAEITAKSTKLLVYLYIIIYNINIDLFISGVMI